MDEMADGLRQRRQLVVVEIKRLQVGEMADGLRQRRQLILTEIKLLQAGELERIESELPDPTSFTNLPKWRSTLVESYDQLENMFRRHRANEATAYGLPMPEYGSAPAMPTAAPNQAPMAAPVVSPQSNPGELSYEEWKSRRGGR